MLLFPGIRWSAREVECATAVPVVPVVVAVSLDFAADLDRVVSANHRHGVHCGKGMEVVIARDIVTEAGIAFGVEIDCREQIELQPGKTQLAAIRLRPTLIEPE